MYLQSHFSVENLSSVLLAPRKVSTSPSLGLTLQRTSARRTITKFGLSAFAALHSLQRKSLWDGDAPHLLQNKFVRTTMRLFNAIFFSIFFSFYWCYLFPLNCTIDFQLISLDFAIDFAIFTMWLQTYGWTDRQTDGQNNRQTDRIMGRQANEWMDMQYLCMNMQKNDDFPIDFAIFTKTLPTDQPTDRPTDGHTLL